MNSVFYMKINSENFQVIQPTIGTCGLSHTRSFPEKILKVQSHLSSLWVKIMSPNPVVSHILAFKHRFRIISGSILMLKAKKQSLSYFSSHSM